MAGLGHLRLFVVASTLSVCATVAVATARTNAVTVFSAKNSALGRILVSTGDRTLYHTSSESRNRIACIGSCAVKWPPLVVTTHAKPTAGTGITASLLGTVRRPDGRLQVTYRGMPLYLYSGDTRGGLINGQGVGGIWHAIAPSGAVVTTPAPRSSSPSSSPASTTGSSMGTGTSTGVNAGMWCAANPKSCVNGVPIGGG